MNSNWSSIKVAFQYHSTSGGRAHKLCNSTQEALLLIAHWCSVWMDGRMDGCVLTSSFAYAVCSALQVRFNLPSSLPPPHLKQTEQAKQQTKERKGRTKFIRAAPSGRVSVLLVSWKLLNWTGDRFKVDWWLIHLEASQQSPDKSQKSHSVLSINKTATNE